MSPLSVRYVSLFSGVGGFCLGADRAGLRCVAQVENDPHCVPVLERHWPDTQKHGDITALYGGDLPDAEIITMGAPCQDLSIAGKRAGLAGERSGLFRDAVRVIREKREATSGGFPRWAIYENVVGALSSNQGEDWAQVLDLLADAGAVVLEWAVLDSQFFGVPQRRRRVFLVAGFDPRAASRPQVLPLSDRSTGDPGACGSTPEAGAAGSGAGVVAFSENQRAEVRTHSLAMSLSTPGGKPGQGYPAIISGGIARKLSPLECERLMGWPDDHTAGLPDGRRYKAIGNGASAGVARWVSERVAESDRRSVLWERVGAARFHAESSELWDLDRFGHSVGDNLDRALTPGDLILHDMYLHRSRLAGVAVSPTGELCSLFNLGPRGLGAEAVRVAVTAGAHHLDCFEGLVPYYEGFGFGVDRYEDNWTPGGPRVAYMSLRSEQDQT